MFVIDRGIVRYLYNYDDIYTEVTKRTSKLGQHRGTEKLMHLLAQMSMTKDEEFIFSPQIKQACALVWEQMYPLANKIPNAYRFNLNTTTKIHRVLPKVEDIITLSTPQTSSTEVSTNHYDLEASYAASVVGTPDWTLYKLISSCIIDYDVWNLHDEERRSASATDIVTTSNPTSLDFTASVEVLEDVSGIMFERFDGNLSANITNRLEFVSPEAFNVGDYVEYGNDLYKVLKNTDENTDINNTEYFVKLKADDRGGIIFEVHQYHWLDDNVFPLVDNAIFELIVHYIMYSWFETTAPTESAVYEKKYQSDLIDLRHRIQSQDRKIRRRYKYY